SGGAGRISDGDETALASDSSRLADSRSPSRASQCRWPFCCRADLYYPAARLVIEYDGANHRDRLVEDNRRQNLLLNAGFRLLRFTASDVHQRPDAVVAQVRRGLVAADLCFDSVL